MPDTHTDDTPMVHATINDMAVTVPRGTTILDAATHANIKIPTLCKHEDLPATAACGICVVKIKGRAQMVRACATPIEDAMEVITQDPEIIQTRRTTLELILSAHPNECLTCARHGTCELQKLAEDFGITRQPLPELVPDLPVDPSTRAVVLEPRKCIKCGRCITVCQQMQDVWALSMLNRGIDTRMSSAGDISLDESPCIRCGQCSAHCPVGAIYEHDDTRHVWNALMDPDIHCVAQIAPAVRVSLGEAFGYPPGTNIVGQVYECLRLLGFDTVFDTNFGADVTIMEEASEFVHRLTGETGPLPLITTCCPSWVDFMEKFYSDMIPHFSSCKSPHEILGVLTKTYYAQHKGIDPASIRVISIMPCTAKKYEIGRTDEMFASGFQDVDISITTREFIRMIRQSGIDLTQLNCLAQADSPLGEYSGAGTIFGTTGGVMEACLRTTNYLLTGDDSKTVEAMDARGYDGVKQLSIQIGERTVRGAVAHGIGYVEQVLQAVKQAAHNDEKPPFDIIEVMACPGGCIGGGGQSWTTSEVIRHKRSEGLYKDDSVRQARCSHQNPSVKKLYERFLHEPLSDKAHSLLHTRYTPRVQYSR
jgi:NADH-quinone oxidoreductase subunit G